MASTVPAILPLALLVSYSELARSIHSYEPFLVLPPDLRSLTPLRDPDPDGVPISSQHHEPIAAFQTAPIEQENL